MKRKWLITKPSRGISRRDSLGGALGFAALGFGRAFAVELGSFSTGKPNLRVGMLSDIHVSHLPGTKGVKPFGHGSGECFLRVLDHYRDLKVDAVLNAGRPISCALGA